MKTVNMLMSSAATAVALFMTMNTAYAGEFVKCERRNNERSKISVEAGDLIPGAIYSATVKSGNNSSTSAIPVAADLGGDAEFDFDSNPNDVMAGATEIAPNFIGSSVSATVSDAMGVVVESGSTNCRVR
jgi:hypothetical protein